MWRFLKKLEIELPYDPAILLLGIHTEETRIDTGCLGLVHWDDPEGCYGEGGGRRGSGLGTHVHPWRIHVDVWQNQYNIVK